MKTKHVIFGVLYAISTAYFIFVGDLIASILMLIILLCMIALSSMKKNLEASTLNFEKTLSHRKKAFDEMFETNMKLTEELKQKTDEIDLWKKGFYDLEEVLNGFKESTTELFAVIDSRNSEIAELKPLAQQRLDYLHHERDRKKSYRKENSDLLRVRRFAKKHAGRVVVRKDGDCFGNSDETTAIVCGYDDEHGSLIVGINSGGWINLDSSDVIIKKHGHDYSYVTLTSIKLIKNETKN